MTKMRFERLVVRSYKNRDNIVLHLPGIAEAIGNGFTNGEIKEDGIVWELQKDIWEENIDLSERLKRLE